MSTAPSAAHICYFLADGAEETEVVTPVDLLRRAGLKVTLAGVDLAAPTARTSHGLGLLPDVLFDGNPAPYDAFVVPGGMHGVQHLMASRSVLDALRAAHAADKWVASICAGPWVLAKAKLLPDGPYTCYPGCEGEIDGGTNWLDQPVVIDETRKLLTSQGAGTAIDFALAIVRVLAGPEAARKVANAIVWRGTLPA